MEFHQLGLTYQEFKSKMKISAKEFYDNAFLYAIDFRNGILYNQIAAERNWHLERKPYYRIWPGIIQPLLKVDLRRVMTESLMLPNDLGCLAILFPKGHELEFRHTDGKNKKVHCLLLGHLSLIKDEHKQKLKTEVRHLPDDPIIRLQYLKRNKDALQHGFICFVDTGDPVHHYIKFKCEPDKSIEEALQDHIFKDILKLVVSLFLLDSDREIMMPDVLSDDRSKWEVSGEEAQKLIEERARRRGKIGWDIGKITETNPHYRNPHFGIRWTGKGATIPKLCRIKGSWVHREKIKVEHEPS